MSLPHILQKIAGKDTHLLDMSSDAERTMYNCLGILVILISLLTFISIGYSLFLVYFPNGFNSHAHVGLKEYLNFIFIALLSFVWTLIVFNFYRFSLSNVSINKYKFTLDLIPKLIVQIFLGLLIGLSISLPLTVVVDHHEYKNDPIKGQEKTLNTIKENIDKKYQVKLDKQYHYLTINLYKQKYLNQALENKLKIKNYPDSSINDLRNENEKINETVLEIQSEIDALREEINKEKIKYEEVIRYNDGLITNIQKAIEKNKKLLILISIFICLILVFPSLFQALYIPGIYDFLVEYKNHQFLSGYGILPNSRTVFIKAEPVHIPYYTLPEELLREKKLELEQLSAEDRKLILKKDSAN